MDFRWIIVLPIGVFGALMILAMVKAKKANKLLREEERKAAAAAEKSAQLEEYNRQLEEMKAQMQEKLVQGTSDDELSARWKELRGEALTGIPAVDLVLHEKKLQCGKANIKWDCAVGKIPDNMMNGSQWMSLIVNLLDNAMEAASKCEDENRWVFLGSRVAKGQLILQVKNGKLADERPMETGMATTKSDSENHGFGTKVISRIVKEQKGYLNMTDGSDVFDVVIALPVKEKTENEKHSDSR